MKEKSFFAKRNRWYTPHTKKSIRTGKNNILNYKLYLLVRHFLRPEGLQKIIILIILLIKISARPIFIYFFDGSTNKRDIFVLLAFIFTPCIFSICKTAWFWIGELLLKALSLRDDFENLHFCVHIQNFKFQIHVSYIYNFQLSQEKQTPQYFIFWIKSLFWALSLQALIDRFWFASFYENFALIYAIVHIEYSKLKNSWQALSLQAFIDRFWFVSFYRNFDFTCSYLVFWTQSSRRALSLQYL